MEDYLLSYQLFLVYVDDGRIWNNTSFGSVTPMDLIKFREKLFFWRNEKVWVLERDLKVVVSFFIKMKEIVVKLQLCLIWLGFIIYFTCFKEKLQKALS